MRHYTDEENDFFDNKDAEQRIFMLERRIALLEQSIKSRKDDIEKIETNINKLVWVVMSAVVLAGLNVIFNGAGGI